MSINIKKHAAVGLVLTSIGGIYPLQAIEKEQSEEYNLGLAWAMSSIHFEKYDSQQIIEDDQDQNQEVHPFNMMDTDIKIILLFDPYFKNNSTNERLGELSLVCKDWNNTLKSRFNSKEEAWKEHYGLEESEYQLLKTIKLQYRPTPNSNEGMITLKIPAFANPFRYKFNLSRCGSADKKICISTGYRTGMNLENKNKIEMFVAPRKMIKKDLISSSAHYKDIMSNWGDNASIGIIYTWGNWDNNNWYDYNTNFTQAENSDKNGLMLYFKCNFIDRKPYLACSELVHTQNFTFVLNKIKD